MTSAISAAGLRSSSCFPDTGIEGQARVMRSTQKPNSTEVLKIHQVRMPDQIGSRMRGRLACRNARCWQVHTGALHVGFMTVPCHTHMSMTSPCLCVRVCEQVCILIHVSQGRNGSAHHGFARRHKMLRHQIAFWHAKRRLIPNR